MFSLGRMPPVNAFIAREEIEKEEAFPLDLYFCRKCTLVQLGDVVEPSKLFSHYLHLSSASQSNIRHLSEVASLLKDRAGPLAGKKILEIGSNDGTLLSFLRKSGAEVLGVDPAANLVETARSKGVETLAAFFSKNLVDSTSAARGPFDAVISINVVAHTPDFTSLLEDVRGVLAPGGVFLIEAAYAIDTILQGQFDTIYHEHVYCFSLHSLAFALKRAGFEVVDAEIIPTQGTSLRVFARRADENPAVGPAVMAILGREKANGYTDERAYREAAQLVTEFKKDFLRQVDALVSRHGPLIGLGAPARGVVIANYCGLDGRTLKYVIDDTPLKQGRLVGGVHVPVKNWEALSEETDPAFILLSWNYRKEVLEKLERYRTTSPILVPFPRIELLQGARVS